MTKLIVCSAFESLEVIFKSIKKEVSIVPETKAVFISFQKSRSSNIFVLLQ